MSGRRKRGYTSVESPPGPSTGWLCLERFGVYGRKPRRRNGVTVAVVNPECDTAWSDEARLALLKRAYHSVPKNGPTLLLASGGFFGYAARAYGKSAWTTYGGSERERQRALASIVEKWPKEFALAVGVDFGPDRQEQWWFRGGDAELKRVVRGVSAFGDRRFEHEGVAFAGFVCGEAYTEKNKRALRAELGGSVHVIAVSSHVRVNRQKKLLVENVHAKRWAFQRLFQTIAPQGGACLAHARSDGADGYVRDCDNWFVHRGRTPFPPDAPSIRVTG